jgi:hypothetical protein
MSIAAGVLAGMLMVALGGCAPARPLRSSSPGGRARVLPDSRPSGTSARDEAVLTAWRAAIVAFDTAALTDDWQSPALAATRVPPELNVARSVIFQMAARGEVAVGTERIIAARVVYVLASRAEVVGCVGGNEIAVFRATGKPVPGVLGEVGQARLDSILVRTPSGWKVRNQTAEEVTCAG